MSTNPDHPLRVLALRWRGVLRNELHYVELPQETALYLGRITDFKGWLSSWTIRLHRGSERGEEIGYCTVERRKLTLTMVTRVFDKNGRQLLWADPIASCATEQWPLIIEVKALAPDWSVTPSVKGRERKLVLHYRGKLAAEIVEQYRVPARTFWTLDARIMLCRVDLYEEAQTDTVVLLCLGLMGAFEEPSSPTA